MKYEFIGKYSRKKQKGFLEIVPKKKTNRKAIIQQRLEFFDKMVSIVRQRIERGERIPDMIIKIQP